MKIIFPNRQTVEGSVLFVTLALASLLILFMFYYLSLVRTQNTSVVRSQAWNGALAMAEAGAEEALAQLNPGAAAVVVDYSANGWVLSGPGGHYGPVSRTLNSGSYNVMFTAYTPLAIFSTGYVTVPALSTTLKRAVMVIVTNTPLFSVAMAARLEIRMNGNKLATDSYDSSNPSLSTNGQYDPSKTSTNGDVASVYGPVNPGNHTITGDLYLGPTATYNGSAGNYTGQRYNDFNVDFPDVVLPNTTWLPAALTNQVIGGTTYNYVLTSTTPTDYLITTSGNIYVGTNANVRVKITASSFSGTIHVTGNASNSGKLTIYMAGASFSSDGFIDSGKTQNLSYFGLTSNTSITWSGNDTFTGTVYAPSADMILNGGGSDTMDFSGSSVTKTVTMNGKFKFHFDENLLKVGPARGYIATSWREI